jgi:restriction system protein
MTVEQITAPPPAAPTFDALLWPTLQALKAMGGSGTNEELLAKVVEVASIPPDVQAVQHTDHRQTKVNYNLAWAKTYLKKIGAIDNSSRGVWSITKLGESLTPADVTTIPSRVRKMVGQGKRAQSSSVEAAPELAVGETVEGAETPWKDELLERLLALKPNAFERLSQRLLREAGFLKVEVTGKSGDGGIDGIGVLRVNLLSFQVLFQCKKYQGSVGASAIRDFRGAMVGRCDKGLMITTGTYTSDAKREATRDGAPAIDLIDGDLLCDLLKRLKLGVRTEMVERMTVEPDFFDRL